MKTGEEEREGGTERGVCCNTLLLTEEAELENNSHSISLRSIQSQHTSRPLPRPEQDGGSALILLPPVFVPMTISSAYHNLYSNDSHNIIIENMSEVKGRRAIINVYLPSTWSPWL